MDATSPSAGIEQHSIDVVPDAERHGRVLAQLPFWFVGNFQFFTVAIGFIGPSMGLGIGWTALAGLLGVLFGTIFMALHASQGPRLGLPQMVQSRAQFGYRGVLVPLFGTLVTFAGYNVVQTKLVADGLATLLSWQRLPVGIVLGVVSFALATWGYVWLHRVFRLLFLFGIAVVGTLTVAALAGVNMAPAHAPATALGWTTAGFAAQLTASASYNLSLAPQVSDYTRYLPAKTRSVTVFASVFAGASGSAIWLIALGAWIAGHLGATDALVGLRDAGDGVLPGFGTIVVVDSVITIAAVMGMGAYSGALTLVTAENCCRDRPVTVAGRVFWTAIVAAGSTVVALLLPGSAVTAVNAVLTIMLYLLVPWTAVNLIDFFVIQRGKYNIPELFNRDGIYGRWNTSGLVSYGAGLMSSVPFMMVSPIFTGPFARRLGGIDVAWLIGLGTAGFCYLVLKGRRGGGSATLPAEQTIKTAR